jgi:hypothetical protein
LREFLPAIVARDFPADPIDISPVPLGRPTSDGQG